MFILILDTWYNDAKFNGNYIYVLNYSLILHTF